MAPIAMPGPPPLGPWLMAQSLFEEHGGSPASGGTRGPEPVMRAPASRVPQVLKKPSGGVALHKAELMTPAPVLRVKSAG
jgi:hypothetical protein